FVQVLYRDAFYTANLLLHARWLAVGPLLVGGATGLLFQLAAWAHTLRTGRLSPVPLALASAGALVTILAACIAREAIRLSTLDLATLSTLHDRARTASGLPVFLLFFTLNTAAIVWAIRLVRRNLHRAA
ncbi:MAG TPA: hypothetical protein VL172_12335, partial [Kofleriaceae bacterium]|nr:hypothetical protein [Kofleriaceae bacterium]